jgi:hypothetical protein
VDPALGDSVSDSGSFLACRQPRSHCDHMMEEDRGLSSLCHKYTNPNHLPKPITLGISFPLNLGDTNISTME